MIAPLTILLIPPDGDASLLADEPCGGRVPRMMRWTCSHHGPGPWLPCLASTGFAAAWSCDPCGERWAAGEPFPPSANYTSIYALVLVLVLGGAPVAMGWDRVRTLLATNLGLDPSGGVVIEPIRVGLRVRWILRTWDDESRTVTDDVDSLDLRDLAPAVAAILGARVVLLRDGREVTE